MRCGAIHCSSRGEASGRATAIPSEGRQRMRLSCCAWLSIALFATACGDVPAQTHDAGTTTPVPDGPPPSDGPAPSDGPGVDSPPAMHTVVVQRTGGGSGTVIGDNGIACGTMCIASLPAGTLVQLIAQP